MYDYIALQEVEDYPFTKKWFSLCIYTMIGVLVMTANIQSSENECYNNALSLSFSDSHKWHISAWSANLRLVIPASIPDNGFPITCGIPMPPGALTVAMDSTCTSAKRQVVSQIYQSGSIRIINRL